MSQVFMALSSTKLADMIQGATRRVALVTPGIHDEVGNALIKAAQRLGHDKIDVVVDFNEKIFRLGYGSIDAITQLKKNGLNIRNHSGLRIGIAICDDTALAFSPVALYIETETNNDDLPNAVTLSSAEATRILLRISESARKEVILTAANPELVQEARSATVEMSVFSVNESKLVEVCKTLEVAPPMPFDISRQVQVFEPYIQYVDLKLQGCSIQKHKIKLPKSIVGLASNKEVEDRLSTTFNLIEKSSSVSAKHLEDDVRRLRDVFTRSLGKLGRVILKAQRKNFDEHVKSIQGKITDYQKKVLNELAGELDKSRNQLVDYFMPLVMARPPMELLAQITGASPTPEQASDWLYDELTVCIPVPESLIGKMELECVFKDVTYDTLKDDALMNVLKEAFPRVDWDKPFSEFTAAKST